MGTNRWGNSRTHLFLQFYNLLMGTNKIEMKQDRLYWILNYICEYHLDEEDRRLNQRKAALEIAKLKQSIDDRQAGVSRRLLRMKRQERAGRMRAQLDQ